jgi:nucleoid-associated protein YgaU
MIFMSAEMGESRRILRGACQYHRFGDLMNKSGSLIATALLTVGIAAAAMAADMPKAAAPMAADAPAAAAPAADAAKPAKKHKKHKKAAAPATTK